MSAKTAKDCMHEYSEVRTEPKKAQKRMSPTRIERMTLRFQMIEVDASVVRSPN